MEAFFAVLLLDLGVFVFVALVFKMTGWRVPPWVPLSGIINRIIRTDPKRVAVIANYFS